MAILLLGGTTEGRTLARELSNLDRDLVVSVATEYGRERLEEKGVGTSSTVRVRQGRLDREGFQRLLREADVDVILDATHPYAKIISDLAADCAEEWDCPYYRWERQTVSLPETSLISTFPSPDDCAKALRETTDRVLLTTGTKHLDRFVEGIPEVDRLFVRVLPFEPSLRRCREAGIPASRIQAMQGPFSVGFNRETYRQYDIETVVTKRSGPPSGVREKITAALEEGISVMVIHRPDLPPADRVFQSVNDVTEALS